VSAEFIKLGPWWTDHLAISCDLPMPEPGDTHAVGQTTLRVTRLGLGTAPIGGLFTTVTEDAAANTVHRAISHGIRYFDTAPQYGFGNAETRLGRGLTGVPRDEVVISTKVGRLLRTDAPRDDSQYYGGEPFFKGTPDVNPVFDFSYEGVMQSLNESLKRLGVDRVDMLFIHDPDQHYALAIEGAFRALDQLRADGTVTAIGVGMNQTELLERFAREVSIDCFLVAGRYTLLDQTALGSLLPLCAERNISVVIGGVYNSGILADPRPGATFNYIPAEPEMVERALRIKAVCDQYSVPLKAASIQFPLGHPSVASVLTGARTAAELEENVEMFRWSIPSELWTELKVAGLLPIDAPTPQGDASLV
jgi:D-threo-aldose 1-dehydrogenase